MKNIIIALSVLLCLSVSKNYAQIDTINFSDFKVPDLKRQILTFNYDLNSFHKFESESDTGQINHNTLYFNLSNRFNSRYSYYKNTRKYQGYYYASVNSDNDFTFHKIIRDSSSILFGSRENNSNNNLHIYIYNKFYYKKNHFWGLDVNVGTTINSSYLKNFYTQNNPQDSGTYNNTHSSDNISTLLSFGKGRIENISDYIQALYIINGLEKEKKLSKKINKDEINRLAELISVIKNKRFFDSREKRIYELEQIDSFFVSNNDISNNDIRYFTNLNDNWSYAGNQNRSEGKTFSFFLKPGYSYMKSINNISDSTLTMKDVNINLSPGFRFNSNKNFNLYWQRNFNFSFAYSLTRYFSEFHPETSDNLSFSAGYGYAWYPNTRTTVKANLYTFYRFDSNNLIFSKTNDYYSNSISFDLNLSGYYYISPKFRLKFDGYFRNHLNFQTTQNKSRRTSLNYKFMFGIEYSIF